MSAYAQAKITYITRPREMLRLLSRHLTGIQFDRHQYAMSKYPHSVDLAVQFERALVWVGSTRHLSKVEITQDDNTVTISTTNRLPDGHDVAKALLDMRQLVRELTDPPVRQSAVTGLSVFVEVADDEILAVSAGPATWWHRLKVGLYLGAGNALVVLAQYLFDKPLTPRVILIAAVIVVAVGLMEAARVPRLKEVNLIEALAGSRNG